jgi:outer membrane biosynthesis protein TonB
LRNTSRGITGTVKFEARIGQDGRIHDLQLLTGPFALYDSARGAVEKWEYRPTKLNGEPVEVITTIDVNYTLSQ